MKQLKIDYLYFQALKKIYEEVGRQNMMVTGYYSFMAYDVDLNRRVGDIDIVVENKSVIEKTKLLDFHCQDFFTYEDLELDNLQTKKLTVAAFEDSKNYLNPDLDLQEVLDTATNFTLSHTMTKVNGISVDFLYNNLEKDYKQVEFCIDTDSLVLNVAHPRYAVQQKLKYIQDLEKLNSVIINNKVVSMLTEHQKKKLAKHKNDVLIFSLTGII